LLFQGIEQVYVAPTSLKKLITGSGRSKKDEVRAYIQKQYPFIEIKNDDESDSLALFYYYTKMLQGKDAN
jgi:Holliday junction resolvasome RuvABC endonuclease subunit